MMVMMLMMVMLIMMMMMVSLFLGLRAERVLLVRGEAAG